MKLSQRGLGVADWLGVNEPQVVLRHSLRLRVQAFICLSAVQGDHVAIRVSIVFRRVGSIGKPKLCKSAVRPPVCELQPAGQVKALGYAVLRNECHMNVLRNIPACTYAQ